MLLCDLFNPFCFRIVVTDYGCAEWLACCDCALSPGVKKKNSDHKLQIGKKC